MLSEELNEYGFELLNLICDVEGLRNRLIKFKADLQDYERSLLIIILSDHRNEVNFIEDEEILLDRMNDPDFLDEIYTTVSEGIVTFYDCKSNPLLSYELSV